MSFWETIKSLFGKKKEVSLDLIINNPSEISEDDLSKITEKAISGDVNNELFAGVLYLKGIRVQQNVVKAQEYLEKSAQEGNVSAQKILAKEYTSGLNFPQNLTKAFELLKKASNSGDAEAMYNLGLLYKEGISAPKDINKAIEYFQKAADLGCIEARIETADIYYDGVDIPIDRLRACQMYKDVLMLNADAVDVGYIYRLLGQAYADKFTNCGLTREEGISFLKKAIDKGYSDAVVTLAFLGGELDEGDRHWLFNLTSQHQDNPHFILALGICYENGYGTFRDAEAAFNYYKKSADLGNPFGKHYAACAYLAGNGVEKSIDEWLRLETKAADQGVPAAQFNLGICYLKGDRVEKNKEKALQLLKMAADNHYEGAIKILQNVDPKLQDSVQEQASPLSSSTVNQKQTQSQTSTSIQVNSSQVQAIEQQNKPKLEFNSEDFH